MDRKDFTATATLKASAGAADEGTLEATFSRFGVIDRDGDVVLASAVPTNTDIMMVWNHRWDMPIGRGVIRNDGQRAIFSGRFFLETTAGMEAYKTVKASGNLQQYSWGFQVLDSEWGNKDGRKVRFIKQTLPIEVSPVLIGSNQHTGTLQIKEANRTDVDGLERDHLLVLARLRGLEPWPVSPGAVDELAAMARSLGVVV